MKIGRFSTHLVYPVIGLLAGVSSLPSRALAQDSRTDTLALHHHQPDQKAGATGLLKVVREVTERFRDVEVAKAAGYELLFGCVSGSEWGAMGMHFVNMSLVFDDGVLDPRQPEIVIYEPLPSGRLRLIGADYLVPAAAWHTKNPTAGPPELMGQLLHLFESPNRFGLPDFYTLHVWAWKDNPNGTFVNWHPRVSCDAFSAQHP
jgi:hypothetical protein